MNMTPTGYQSRYQRAPISVVGRGWVNDTRAGAAPELKVVEGAFALAAARQDEIVLNNGIWVLNIPAQGAEFNQRTGRQITIKSVNMKMNFQCDATGGTPPVPGETIRIVLFWDRQPNGTNATWSNVFTTTSSGINAMMNLDNRERFVMIKDDTISKAAMLQSGGLIVVSGENTLFPFWQFYKKMNCTTIFNTTTGIGTAIQSGALVCMIWTTAIAANSQWYMDGMWRVRYTDV